MSAQQPPSPEGITGDIVIDSPTGAIVPGLASGLTREDFERVNEAYEIAGPRPPHPIQQALEVLLLLVRSEGPRPPAGGALRRGVLPVGARLQIEDGQRAHRGRRHPVVPPGTRVPIALQQPGPQRGHERPVPAVPRTLPNR